MFIALNSFFSSLRFSITKFLIFPHKSEIEVKTKILKISKNSGAKCFKITKDFYSSALKKNTVFFYLLFKYFFKLYNRAIRYFCNYKYILISRMLAVNFTYVIYYYFSLKNFEKTHVLILVHMLSLFYI